MPKHKHKEPERRVLPPFQPDTLVDGLDWWGLRRVDRSIDKIFDHDEDTEKVWWTVMTLTNRWCLRGPVPLSDVYDALNHSYGSDAARRYLIKAINEEGNGIRLVHCRSRLAVAS